ncbi:MAG: NRDE family protein [Halieaceae bacterium]|jgi:uncharacterized protein with NRDE domain|nr:NRDE family protein [Halieaceae bacterium]
MCLVILGHRACSEYPLIVAANRDEFYARKTEASTFWPQHPNLLAGRDLEQGGTWMGVTRCGRFAAITNFRDPAATAMAPRSRGELPLQYLVGNMTAGAFLNRIAERSSLYAGFNLLLGDREEMWYFSNSPRQTNGEPAGGSPEPPRILAPGIYGLSNALLDTPWPKVERGKQGLTRALQAPVDHDTLMHLIDDRHLADRNARTAFDISEDMDYLLSAQFIVTDTYGTRSSTTLWSGRDGRVNWRELSFDQHGIIRTTREENFCLHTNESLGHL